MKIAKLLTAVALSARLGFAAQAQEETPVDMKDLPPEAQTTIKEKAGSDQILCLPVFFIFWPEPLQFVFVDSAIAELVGFGPQLTPD